MSIRMHVCEWIMYTGVTDAFWELHGGRGHAMTRTSGQSKGGGTARAGHTCLVSRERPMHAELKNHIVLVEDLALVRCQHFKMAFCYSLSEQQQQHTPRQPGASHT